MKPASGSIPENIAVITGDTQKVQIGCPWDLDKSFSYLEEDEQESSELDTLEVLPAFISDANSPKSITTGKRWAERKPYGVQATTVAKVEIKKNIPIKNVQICSLVNRGPSGTCYKVIADGVYVDCREDVIIDAILKEGVDKGGILRGEYIWTKLSSHSRLVRIGSTLHKRISLMNNRRELKKISLNDLIPGTVYGSKKDKRALYLGKINTTHWSYKSQREGGKPYEFFNQDLLGQHLFIEIPETHEKDVNKFIQTEMKDRDGTAFNFNSRFMDRLREPFFWTKMMRSSSYVVEIEKCDITGLIDRLRTRARYEIKKCCRNLANGKTDEGWQYSNINLSQDISTHSDIANMYESTGPAVEPFDYEPLLTFI